MKGYARLWVPLACYGLLCLILFFADPARAWMYFMMAWNVFLAALPLVFLLSGEKAGNAGRKKTALLLGLLWLLFFPNSVYMPTDMLHLAGEVFYTSAGPYEPVTFTRNLALWLCLMVIACGIWMSVLLVLESLRRAAAAVRRRCGLPLSGLLAVGVALLSGLGVYIGRFLRLNSWDVLRPVRLVRNLLDGLDGFALSFSVCYGAFVLLSFLLYLLLTSCVRERD